MSTITEDLKSEIVAKILDDSEMFNLVMRRNLEDYKHGKLSEHRFLQLRNNARGNALDAARRASRHCPV